VKQTGGRRSRSRSPVRRGDREKRSPRRRRDSG
jgi:hypothetical protein